jgi:mono/diheme cytochrome c family protein
MWALPQPADMAQRSAGVRVGPCVDGRTLALGLISAALDLVRYEGQDGHLLNCGLLSGFGRLDIHQRWRLAKSRAFGLGIGVSGVEEMQRFLLVCLMTGLLLGDGASADTIGDPVRGLQVARDQCAACHQVEANQPLVTNQAASFKDIANTQGMTALALSVWFRTSHRDMPNIILSTEQQDDLISYIVGLRDSDQ